MIRLYLSKVRGDGQTIETAYIPAFNELLPGKPRKQIVDSFGSHALIVADMTEPEHTTVTSGNEVFEVESSLLPKPRSDLTGPENASLNQALAGIGRGNANGIFTPAATVLTVIRWIRGSVDWDGETDLGL